MPDVFISNPGTPDDSEAPHLPPHIPRTENQKKKFPGHTHHKLSAFSLYPEGVDFETRKDDEKIILLLRAHPITNLRWIFTGLLMLTVPTIVSLIGFFNILTPGLSLVISLSWYLLTMAYALENFLSWYFNVYMVTTMRVVDVDFFNLVYKQVSDAPLGKIQDVTYNMGGVVRTIFNYGNVFIQTAAEVQEFEFLAVPSPDKVAKVIGDAMSNIKE